MRLLILSLNYSPEPTGFAPHTTALAEHLQTAGFDVTVLTGFPFAPRWVRWPEYRGEFVRDEMMNGVAVKRVTHFIPRKPGRALQRILMEGSFAFAAGSRILLEQRDRYDTVLYVGAQPAIAWLARILGRLWHVPYIVKITDLAAAAAIDVGMVKRGLLASALRHFETSAYRRADAAIVLCNSFKDVLTADGFAADDIHLIRDSVDLKAINAKGSGADFRGRHGIGRDEFVVLYAGSLGLKQGLFDVVKAARWSADNAPSVRWVVVGEGETRDALSARIAESRIGDRVMLLPLEPEEHVGEMLRAADVLLLSQIRSVRDSVIPSKLLLYMAAGRPVIAAVNASSQAATLVSVSAAGVIIEPENPRALADAVVDMKSRPADRDDMGERGRAYAKRHFDRDRILQAQQQVIEQVIARRPISVTPAADSARN